MKPTTKRHKKILSIAKTNSNLQNLEAILTFLKKNHTLKFDSSVDVVFNLNVNPKRAEHNLKGTYQLKNPFVIQKRICVFTNNADAFLKAQSLKVDLVGKTELINEIIKNGKIDFDVAIATPDIMPELAKLGRILGPRKLMPTLKNGTVTNDLVDIVQKIRTGYFTYQIDGGGNLHFRIGKLSQSVDALKENFYQIHNLVKAIKPSFIKKQYLKKISLNATMSPGYKIDLKQI